MAGEFGMRRWAMAALAVASAAILVTVAYQAGVSHGIALQPPPVAAPAAPGAAPGVAPGGPPPYAYYPYGYYGPRRFGFFGPLLGLLLFVFVLRSLFWGFGGWGWRRRWRYYDYRDHPGGGPSPFDEWHRRAHERMGGDRGPAAPTNV